MSNIPSKRQLPPSRISSATRLWVAKVIVDALSNQNIVAVVLGITIGVIQDGVIRDSVLGLRIFFREANIKSDKNVRAIRRFGV